MDMINKSIRDFENKLVEDINNSGMPMELVRIMLENILSKVEKLAMDEVVKELMAEAEKEAQNAESTQ